MPHDIAQNNQHNVTQYNLEQRRIRIIPHGTIRKITTKHRTTEVLCFIVFFSIYCCSAFWGGGLIILAKFQNLIGLYIGGGWGLHTLFGGGFSTCTTTTPSNTLTTTHHIKPNTAPHGTVQSAGGNTTHCDRTQHNRKQPTQPCSPEKQQNSRPITTLPTQHTNRHRILLMSKQCGPHQNRPDSSARSPSPGELVYPRVLA